MTKNFVDCFDCLVGAGYETVNGMEFYREIFPDNECSYERHMDYSHPNALYLYDLPCNDGEETRKARRTMYADTWQEDYLTYVMGQKGTLCSGLAYRGCRNTLANAQRMHALIIDVDGVGYKELRSFFLRFGGDPNGLKRLPEPTYIVLSGNGVHLYYVFDKPIDLYPNIKVQMKSLKYDLTFKAWDYKGTSQVKSVQYQSISQGFRMVGSINEKYGDDTVVTAFRYGKRVTLDYLNAYAQPKNRVDLTRPFSPTQIPIDTAKVMYPQWYEKVVVKGVPSAKKWDIAGKVHGDDPWALYHWWLNHVELIRGGHRYFFVMCAAIYAYKCDVPKDVLLADMKSLFDKLHSIEHENEFSEFDIQNAIEAYDKEYSKFTIADIEKLCDVRINKNKRSGLPQREHLKIARSARDVRQGMKNREWRDGSGPKTKRDAVKEWRMNNPDGTKIECERATGMCRKTVLKWWDCTDPQPSDREKVETWCAAHPGGKKKQCERDTGCSDYAVRKWWKTDIAVTFTVEVLDEYETFDVTVDVPAEEMPVLQSCAQKYYESDLTAVEMCDCAELSDLHQRVCEAAYGRIAQQSVEYAKTIGQTLELETVLAEVAEKVPIFVNWPLFDGKKYM